MHRIAILPAAVVIGLFLSHMAVAETVDEGGPVKREDPGMPPGPEDDVAGTQSKPNVQSGKTDGGQASNSGRSESCHGGTVRCLNGGGWLVFKKR